MALILGSMRMEYSSGNRKKTIVGVGTGPLVKKKVSYKTYTAKVEHLDATDPHAEGELCVRLPDELLEQLGWKIGDELDWEENEMCEDWGGGAHGTYLVKFIQT